MGIVDRILGRKEKAAVGGGWSLPVSGGYLPESYGQFWNFWQMGKDPVDGGDCPMVHACVDAYAQTAASLAVSHFRYDQNTAGKAVVRNSALSRVLHNPNEYQTRSDFMFNLVKNLMYTGNAYAVAYRNDRREVTSLHVVPSRSTQVYVDPETKAVFYAVGDNPLTGDISAMVPSRDVLHVKLYTPRHPLEGVSPITNLGMAISANEAISRHQAVFFNQMSRPSGVLTTDERMNREQLTQLREAWNSQSKSLNSGGVPILTAGLKWQSLSLSSQDAQLIKAFNMSDDTIARGMRVPLPLVGRLENASYNNVEQLISSWLSTGLGFLINHIELSFDKFFNLSQDDFTEFEVESLLRTDFAGRIAGLTAGIQGGLFTPNEARAKEGLSAVNNGDKPYMQQQMIELGYRPEQPQEPPKPPQVDPETEKAIAMSAIKKAMMQ